MKNDEKTDIVRIKNIITKIINFLEKYIADMENDNFEPNQQQQQIFYCLVGGKENIVSIITKLGRLLIKLNEFDDSKNNSSGDNIELNEIDIQLIQKFLREREEK